jgi:hypothetical protein
LIETLGALIEMLLAGSPTFWMPAYVKVCPFTVEPNGATTPFNDTDTRLPVSNITLLAPSNRMIPNGAATVPLISIASALNVTLPPAESTASGLPGARATSMRPPTNGVSTRLPPDCATSATENRNWLNVVG